MISYLLLLTASVLTTSASPAEGVANLHRRYPYAGGGWALIINPQATCPAGTYAVPNQNNLDTYIACCPNTLESQANEDSSEHTQQWACCPPGTLLPILNSLIHNNELTLFR